jgi:hypothetical protein
MALDGQQTLSICATRRLRCQPPGRTSPDAEQVTLLRARAKSEHEPPGSAALDSCQFSLSLVQGRAQPSLLRFGLPDLPILGQDWRLGLAELLVLALE